MYDNLCVPVEIVGDGFPQHLDKAELCQASTARGHLFWFVSVWVVRVCESTALVEIKSSSFSPLDES